MIDEDGENPLIDLVRDMFDTIKKGVENSIPCVVISVQSRTKATVRPLIKIVDKEGNTYPRSEIEGVPIYTAGAGDLLVSFPVKPGNLGWLDATDRDISLFIQSYADSAPPTRRMHSFSDARFIPDIMTNFAIAAEDEQALVIQNRSGSVKIALDDNQIRIKNDTVSLVIDGDSVTGTAPGGFNLNGATITSDGDVITASGVSLDNHPHNQANDSGGNVEQPTDAPTPTP